MNRSPALLSAAAAALLACTAPQPGEQSAAGSAAPKAGGTISVEEQNDPYNFDLSIAGISRGNTHASDLAYDSLLTFKKGPGVDYTTIELAPNLAERWEVSPDAKVYTFHRSEERRVGKECRL